MALSTVYSLAHRYVAAGVVVLVGGAVLSALLGGLPGDAKEATLIVIGWGIAAVCTSIVLVASPRPRTQAALWALSLFSSAMAYGGTESSSIERILTLLAAACAFVMALVVTLVQAEESAAESPDRF